MIGDEVRLDFSYLAAFTQLKVGFLTFIRMKKLKGGVYLSPSRVCTWRVSISGFG
jgi:hypothetical protein